ncbi:MAG TPA: Na+/H+ antiporter NhaC [Bacteroidales bacterium]|nr:Na+/H+ antiporter NhaC [Bacteroidales bacterium]
MIEGEHKLSLPPLWLALIPIIVTAISLSFSVFIFDAEPHFALILGAATASLCAYFYGYSWVIIEDGLKKAIARTIPSLIILLIIGMLMSVWLASGIVPIIMYYGFEIINVNWFLAVTFLLCSGMSLISGSAWSTIGTLGVAAVGMSEGMGVPVEYAAGAIVSGAFFGDKLSPMSDSTNLTPSVLGVNLYDHIKHMLYSTIPAFVISLIFYIVLGFTLSGSDTLTESVYYSEYIRENFNFSILLLIPPVVVIFLIVRKVPAIPSLISGVILGSAVFLIIQDGSFELLLKFIHNGFVIDTGNSQIDGLFSRGGMESMYNVISLALVSLAFGGIMDRTNMLKSIVHSISKFLKHQGGLTLTVILSAIIVNAIGANQYLAVILPGQMYENSYRKLNLKLKNLTRSLESGGTLTAPLIPWNSSAVFIYATIGVATKDYFIFAILCWITLFIEIFLAFANITMAKYDIVESIDQQ